MNQNFEQDIPFLPLVIGFLLLMVLSRVIQKKFRQRHLKREGQIFSESGDPLPIEKRLEANKEWASGIIHSRGNRLVIVLWILAIVWNLTFGVSFFKSLSNPEMNTAASVVLGIFAACGLVPVFFSLRLTVRQLKFGESYCQIDGKAGVLGKTISGRIFNKNDIQPTGDYTVELQCIDIYTAGSGKNSRSEQKMHWQSKQTVTAAGRSTRAGIPFSFELPKFPPETGYQLAKGRINWQLSISAPVQNLKYSALFVIPVFKIDYSE